MVTTPTATGTGKLPPALAKSILPTPPEAGGVELHHPEAHAPAAGHAAPWQNVGDVERWGSAVAGGLLVAFGLTRGWLGRALFGGLGAGLLYRGVSGHCHVYGLLGLN